MVLKTITLTHEDDCSQRQHCRFHDGCILDTNIMIYHVSINCIDGSTYQISQIVHNPNVLSRIKHVPSNRLDQDEYGTVQSLSECTNIH